MTEDDSAPFPTEPLTEVDVEIKIDAADLDRVRAAYWQAVRAGYSEGFFQYVYNHCAHSSAAVAVDGEPVNPDIDDWLELDEENGGGRTYSGP